MWAMLIPRGGSIVSDYGFDIVVIGGGPAGAAAAKAATKGGLKALLIEKKKLPRHKPCSGVIMPAAAEYIERYFGPVPDDVLAEPTWKGSHFHLRKGQVFVMPATHLNAWRDRLDNWLCMQSGAEIWESTRLLDFAEWNDHVELICRREGEEVRLSAPVMVAADGGVSDIVKKIDPTFGEGLGMTYSHQDYRRGSVDLDPSYYHIFLQPGIGLMPTLYFKDDIMVTDTVIFPGAKVNPMREKYTAWLADNHGFKPGESVMTLACLATAPSSINRFCFGTDRVLVAGEAAGFMNMAFEGISSALATGYLAGKAATESAGHPPGLVYRKSVKPERERTVREWHLPSIMTGKAAPMMKESIMAAPLTMRLRAMNELTAWIKGFGYKNSDAFELMLRKSLSGDFNFRA
jgi:flavin-dependent dehydrogenase